VAAVVLVFVLAWLLRHPLMTFAGGLLVKTDEPSKADAIVVLGGDSFGTRILKAAELAKAGLAPTVWVSGPLNLMGHDSDGDILYAENHGYPADLFHPVFLDADADSTKGEALLIGKELRAKGMHHVIVVTSDYHTRRARYLWHKLNPWLQVEVVSAPDPYFTPQTWRKTRQGQKIFLIEWLKTISSHLGN
jgi:uncharacterized SAM-binding protein YcdF (DUF218 family)